MSTYINQVTYSIGGLVDNVQGKRVSKSNGPTMVMSLEGALLWYISLYMGTMCLSLAYSLS